MRTRAACCRIAIDAARLLVMHAAAAIDAVGAKHARKEIAMIKVFVPRAVLKVIDRAIQIYGGAGVSDDAILARAWAGMRTLRIADGPDIVHLRTVALLELRDYMRGGRSPPLHHTNVAAAVAAASPAKL